MEKKSVSLILEDQIIVATHFQNIDDQLIQQLQHEDLQAIQQQIDISLNLIKEDFLKNKYQAIYQLQKQDVFFPQIQSNISGIPNKNLNSLLNFIDQFVIILKQNYSNQFEQNNEIWNDYTDKRSQITAIIELFNKLQFSKRDNNKQILVSFIKENFQKLFDIIKANLNFVFSLYLHQFNQIGWQNQFSNKLDDNLKEEEKVQIDQKKQKVSVSQEVQIEQKKKQLKESTPKSSDMNSYEDSIQQKDEQQLQFLSVKCFINDIIKYDQYTYYSKLSGFMAKANREFQKIFDENKIKYDKVLFKGKLKENLYYEFKDKFNLIMAKNILIKEKKYATKDHKIFKNIGHIGLTTKEEIGDVEEFFT